MQMHRPTIARLVFAIWAGIALYFMLAEHRAGSFGVWHYVLLLLCPALLYVATWNDGRGDASEQSLPASAKSTRPERDQP